MLFKSTKGSPRKDEGNTVDGEGEGGVIHRKALQQGGFTSIWECFNCLTCDLKVVYQSESLSPVLASLSRTAELATRLKLTGEKMASENWQVLSSDQRVSKISFFLR